MSNSKKKNPFLFLFMLLIACNADDAQDSLKPIVSQFETNSGEVFTTPYGYYEKGVDNLFIIHLINGKMVIDDWEVSCEYDKDTTQGIILLLNSNSVDSISEGKYNFNANQQGQSLPKIKFFFDFDPGRFDLCYLSSQIPENTITDGELTITKVGEEYSLKYKFVSEEMIINGVYIGEINCVEDSTC